MELYHAPRFRSTRVIILYKELLRAYSSEVDAIESEECEPKSGSKINAKAHLPVLRVHTFYDTDSFRSNKPEWYLMMNENGKVPYFRDFRCPKDGEEVGNIVFSDLSVSTDPRAKQCQMVEIFE